MNRLIPILTVTLLLMGSCTSQKKLAYLNNLPISNGEETFNVNIPEYKIQPRDILYITVKALTPDGSIRDFLTGGSASGINIAQGESGGAFFGYNVNSDGNISIATVGLVKVGGLTLEESRSAIQESVDKVYKGSTVECKLLSFKFTVIGEVKAPGAYINYNNYLTVLEAIGRAGGVSDLGNRDRVLVIRPLDKGAKTFRINLQDKSLITSEAYFLLPNDVVIVEPLKQKIFNMNLPVISFVISTFTATVSMTLLLINYLK